MNYNKLQTQIDAFIGKFGSAALITYLDDFCTLNPEKDYEYLNLLNSAVCDVYGVNEVQLRDISIRKPDVVDARRQFVYLTTVSKSLPTTFIERWFGCSQRAVYKYQKESKQRIAESRFYKKFNNEHNSIKEKLQPHE